MPNLAKTIATAKTTMPTFSIEPELKEALSTAAEREHRSIASGRRTKEITARATEIQHGN